MKAIEEMNKLGLFKGKKTKKSKKGKKKSKNVISDKKHNTKKSKKNIQDKNKTKKPSMKGLNSYIDPLTGRQVHEAVSYGTKMMPNVGQSKPMQYPIQPPLSIQPSRFEDNKKEDKKEIINKDYDKKLLQYFANFDDQNNVKFKNFTDTIEDSFTTKFKTNSVQFENELKSELQDKHDKNEKKIKRLSEKIDEAEQDNIIRYHNPIQIKKDVADKNISTGFVKYDDDIDISNNNYDNYDIDDDIDDDEFNDDDEFINDK
jgi:hypothetical protein